MAFDCVLSKPARRLVGSKSRRKKTIPPCLTWQEKHPTHSEPLDLPVKMKFGKTRSAVGLELFFAKLEVQYCTLVVAPRATVIIEYETTVHESRCLFKIPRLKRWA